MNECNLEVCRKLEPLMNLSKCCGWWIPYENLCILQHRHSSLSLDQNGRIHNPDGMAIEYRDGWGVYGWHGVRVPEQIIKSEPTIKLIDETHNMEHKRVLIERMGYDEYLNRSSASLISSDSYGDMYAMPHDPDRYFVKVINGTPNPDGTPKTYVLPVPKWNEITSAQMQTAHEAVAWSYGLPVNLYQETIRT